MRTVLPMLVLLAACRGEDARHAAVDEPRGTRLAVSPDGVGPVKTGWTLDQLNAALGEQLHPTFEVNEVCDYLDPAALPPGIGLMILQDTIVRIDVDTTGIPTTEGAMVGDTEARILELYRGRVEVQPHKYTGPVGHYLVVRVPRDTLRLIIFETDGQKVLNYRAGFRPAVEFIEGCA
jgi:hypothetical protein